MEDVLNRNWRYHRSSPFNRLKDTTRKRIQQLRQVVGYSEQAAKLAAEIQLLSSYSTDTIYRLRYDTMRYDYISPSVTRLLGFTPEEMKEINLRSLILETRMVTDGMKTVVSFNDLERTRKSGDVSKWQADYLIRTKDGRKIWVADVSYPWFNERGTIIGSIGSLRDISERVAAEEQVKEELARLAHTDALTGLANRREFFRRVDYELKRLQRTKTELSMMIVDVDHFKKINDTYGHDTGDLVLAELAKVIEGCLRETDLAARLGGEEFGVFLPDTPSKGAYWVAERICKTVARHTFYTDTKRQEYLACTVSVGVAAVDIDGTLDSTKLYKLADTRLYIAKNTGRNQVSIDEIVQVH